VPLKEKCRAFEGLCHGYELNAQKVEDDAGNEEQVRPVVIRGTHRNFRRAALPEVALVPGTREDEEQTLPLSNV
jgi:hypothetical protein